MRAVCVSFHCWRGGPPIAAPGARRWRGSGLKALCLVSVRRRHSPRCAESMRVALRAVLFASGAAGVV